MRWWIALVLLMGCVEPRGTVAAGASASAPSTRVVAPGTSGESVSSSSASPASSSASAPSARPASSAKGAPKVTPRQELTWTYETSPVGPTSVVVFSPQTTKPLPVLVALHGLGEAQKGAKRGARGWIDDYGLLTAVDRLHAPPLTRADFLRLGTRAHLDEVNAGLVTHPYEGLIVVCPYTPDILGVDRSLDGADALGEFIVNHVLPRVYRETPAIGTAAATGIDGVSLGGRAALLVGAAHPDRFGVVASMQAAIYGHEIKPLAQRLEDAQRAQPNLAIRLLTSSNDFYRPVVTELSQALGARRVEHHFVDLEGGPHSYAFNRGLGVYAMLLFHDDALRAASAKHGDHPAVEP